MRRWAGVNAAAGIHARALRLRWLPVSSMADSVMNGYTGYVGVSGHVFAPVAGVLAELAVGEWT